MNIKIVELFSGIGAQMKALKNIEKKKRINVELLNTCEWDPVAVLAYDLIHKPKKVKQKKLTREELLEFLNNMNFCVVQNRKTNSSSFNRLPTSVLQRIYEANTNTKNLVDISSITGNSLPNEIDLLTYSFPCQDLSTIGSIHGFNKGIKRNSNNRSSLLWEVERILIERQNGNLKLPKVLVMENVVSIKSPRHIKDFEEWQTVLEELGYFNKVYTLSATDFGIPQYRKRVFMISILVPQNKKETVKKYFENNDLEDFSVRTRKLSSFLKLDKEGKYFDEALSSQPNDTSSRLKIWQNNKVLYSELGEYADFTLTLTTKQDRHPNAGNIFFNVDNGKSKFRYLTPRECFLLMGFKEKDFENIINENLLNNDGTSYFSNARLYKLTGNSIVVNMLEEVFSQVIDILRLIKA